MCRDDMPCDLCCVPPAVHSTNIFNLSKIVKNLVEYNRVRNEFKKYLLFVQKIIKISLFFLIYIYLFLILSIVILPLHVPTWLPVLDLVYYRSSKLYYVLIL